MQGVQAMRGEMSTEDPNQRTDAKGAWRPWKRPTVSKARTICLDLVNVRIDGKVPVGVWQKELREAKHLRRISGGCDYLISENAKKQEPQGEGTHRQASEGKTEQETVADATRPDDLREFALHHAYVRTLSISTRENRDGHHPIMLQNSTR